MNAKVIAAALAVTITSGMLSMAAGAVTEGSKVQLANQLDRCPYYPSPVLCHNDLRAHVTTQSLTRRGDLD
jgi:hypothetical protein